MTDSAVASQIWSAIRSCFRLPTRVFFACRRFICFGLFAGVLPLVASCSALAPRNETVSTIVKGSAADKSSSSSPDFELRGRLSVKGGKEGFSGGVQWHHSEETDDILLLSPLGQALAQIQRIPEGVFLTTSEQEHYYADDVESLTEQVLGWRLPLAGLQYWVQGMNSPDTSSAMDLDVNGRVVAIRQDGWEIGYAGYPPLQPDQVCQGEHASQVAEAAPAIRCVSETQEIHTVQIRMVRPRLLTLRRADLQIKLVIDDWNFDSN